MPLEKRNKGTSSNEGTKELALIAKAIGQPISLNTWILDSGATSHVSY